MYMHTDNKQTSLGLRTPYCGEHEDEIASPASRPHTQPSPGLQSLARLISLYMDVYMWAGCRHDPEWSDNVKSDLV